MNYLAIDLGAESGRFIVGSLDEGRISLEEIYRFPNKPLRIENSIQWNFPEIENHIQQGVSKVAGRSITSVSADSWGVDYVLLGVGGPVYHYRDPRNLRSSAEFLRKVPWETIFSETGIQYMPINTLFQLAAEPIDRLNAAKGLLSIADYVNHTLGARAVVEESMASTFQLYNPRKRAWSTVLTDELGIRRTFLPEVVPSGTLLGDANVRFAENPDEKMQVIATCSHDTGCAVAAVPARSKTNWAYLSSGTWSLMGVERAKPIINDLARELNFTNEIGYGGSIRLLKNISGLWLLQECRRVWSEAGHQFDYGVLTEQAAAEESFRSIINPADQRFLAPANMADEIAAFCRETNQAEPTTPPQFTRCIFESLALLYRRTLRQIEKLTGDRVEVLHIVGGGSKNSLLNQFTADACGIEVLAGPVEATALGNIMIQAITLGEVADLATARAMIRDNFAPKQFTPSNRAAWDDAFARFEKFAS